MHRLIVSSLVLCFLSNIAFAEGEPRILLEDTFTVKPGEREAGSDLANQSVEKGNVSWKRSGNLAIAPEGWVTAAGKGGSVGVVPIPPPTGVISLKADVNPAKSGFVALTFMERGDLNFWSDAPLWVSLWPNGKCEVRAANMKQVVFTSEGGNGFNKDQMNQVELLYDSTANTVSLKLNQALLLDKAALDAKPSIAFGGFRFQEPLTENGPALDNFTVSEIGGDLSSAPAKVALPPLPKPVEFPTPAQPITTLIGQPLWSSEVTTHEPLCFIDSGDGQGPVAKLLFPADQIVSIQSSNLQQEFKSGVDLKWQPGSNVVTLPAGSGIPFLKVADLFPAASSKDAIKAARGARAQKLEGERWLRFGENPRAFFSEQVLVTYRHQGKWGGYQPTFAGEALARSIAKLKSKQPVKIVVLGDSISAGCSTSGSMHVPPLQPSYPGLVADGLKTAYGADISVINLSKGGQVATYGLAQVPLLISAQPDLVILAFGMNDGSASISPESYGGTIGKTVRAIQKGLPEADIILVSTILGNPEWTASAPQLYPAYADQLKALAGPGVAVADVTALSTEMLKVKSFADITVNGVNHPNDFGHRLYAQTILGLLTPERP